MIRVAIMASGTGSNAKALLSCERDISDVSIDLIITDQLQAGVINIAQEFSKKCLVIPKEQKTKEEHENLIAMALAEHQIDWIFLAGYMRILSPRFIKKYFDKSIQQSRIVNIHPSLLPHYRGLNAYERAFEDQSEATGITIHFVDAGMDTGKIILQKRFEYNPSEGLEAFKKKGLSLEHQLYPQVLKSLPELQNKGQI